MSAEALVRIGEQWNLALHGEVDPSRAEPWLGRSPRTLTRGHGFRIFKAQAGKSVSDFVSDENQSDLWLAVKKCPVVYDGAPLLLPFKEAQHGPRKLRRS